MSTRPKVAPGEVLVVDDNDDVRESFVMLLLMHGYRASGVSSGFGALRRLQDGLRPAVMLLDLRMPGMDGWQVWEYMRSDPRFAGIPVVMVSGDPEESRRAEASGLRNFIRKPVDAQKLIDVVAQHAVV